MAVPRKQNVKLHNLSTCVSTNSIDKIDEVEDKSRIDTDECLSMFLCKRNAKHHMLYNLFFLNVK